MLIKTFISHCFTIAGTCANVGLCTKIFSFTTQHVITPRTHILGIDIEPHFSSLLSKKKIDKKNFFFRQTHISQQPHVRGGKAFP